MKFRNGWVAVLFLLFAAASLAAQDAAIEGALSNVSAERIKAGVFKPVSFGTRHTGSLEDDPPPSVFLLAFPSYIFYYAVSCKEF